jgi:inhibitor of KinA sporulation pathway (predicted exonuclease)
MHTERAKHPRFDLSRILVIDLEATCWQGPPPPGEEHEVIEIGNAILHVGDLHVEPGPEILVKPTRSSVSPFCTELTSITQEMLDERGLPFAEAIAVLEAAHGGLRAVVWASYGNYDRRMLLAECVRYGVEFPLSDTHLNVKRMVALMGGWVRETGMLRAMRRLRLDPTPGGTHHRGNDDAVEIARMLGLAMRGSRGELVSLAARSRCDEAAAEDVPALPDGR